MKYILSLGKGKSPTLDHSKFKKSPAYPSPSLTMRLRLVYELFGHAQGMRVGKPV